MYLGNGCIWISKLVFFGHHLQTFSLSRSMGMWQGSLPWVLLYLDIDANYAPRYYILSLLLIRLRRQITLMHSYIQIFYENGNLDRVKRIWYLSPMRAAKVQASLRIRAVSPEPSLLAHTSSESRGTFRQKARSLAPLNGWACAVKICHDGMLEDTNSLDGAHFMCVDSSIQFEQIQGFLGNLRAVYGPLAQ